MSRFPSSVRRQLRFTLFTLFAVCTATLLVSPPASAGDDDDPNKRAVQPPPYNPYPPGILPSDLVSEIARVRREVVTIEAEAIAQWHALPPPTFTGQPPTLQGTGMRANQLLGKIMNF